MKTKLRKITLVVLLLFVAATLAYAGDDNTFTSFDFPSAADTAPTSITPAGDITGNYISADGTQHGFDANRERDLVRDENLRRVGYKILRFANPKIDRELDAVMETILSALTSADPTRLSAARFATLPFGEG